MINKSRKIINQLQRNYTIIAEDFSQTRSKHLWPELERLTKIVQPGDKILDVGCGNARIFEEIKNQQVDYLGIDFVEEFLKANKKKYPDAEFKLVDITKRKSWQKVDQKYDLLFCVAVLHHLPCRQIHQQVLESMHKVLKKDGQLVITVWNLWQMRFWKKHVQQLPKKVLAGMKFKWLWVPYRISDGDQITEEVERFHYAFTKRELSGLLKKSGFSLEEAYFSPKEEEKGWKKGANLCFVAEK